MILPSTPPAGAKHVADKMCELVSTLAIACAPGRTVQVTVSIGAATTVPARGESSRVLIEAADAALYEAKREGKNRAILRQIGD